MGRPIRVLFFLPSILNFPDRAKVIVNVGQQIDKMILLTGTSDLLLDAKGFDKIEIVDAQFKKGQRPLNVLKANRLASRLIRDEAINVVHDTYATLLPLFIRRKHRFPEVAFCTSIFANEGWRIGRVFNEKPKLTLLRSRTTAVMFINRVFEKAVCARADRIVVQAPGLIGRIQAYNNVPKERITFLPNSVDAEYWAPANNVGITAKKSGPIRLMFAGGIGPTRGSQVLIQAMKLIVRSGIDATLTMIGNFEFGAEINVRRLVDQFELHERIKFLGRIPRNAMADHFSQHDLFLYQTINDGSPRIVLEAMSSGIPIIASRHPGIDILDPNGSVISFTEFGDSRRVADLVADYSQNAAPWIERAQCGRERAIANFSTATIAARYSDFYRALVESTNF